MFDHIENKEKHAEQARKDLGLPPMRTSFLGKIVDAMKDHEKQENAAPGGACAADCSAINIVFDGPPGPEAGRFVEVETDDGKGVNIGRWHERDDGMWVLRIHELPNR